MSQSSSTQRLVLVVGAAVIAGIVASAISDSIWFGIVVAGAILAVIAWIARPRSSTPQSRTRGGNTGYYDTASPAWIAADSGDRGRDDDRGGDGRDDSNRGAGDGSGDGGSDSGGDSGGGGDSGDGDSGGGDSGGGGGSGDGGSSSA